MKHVILALVAAVSFNVFAMSPVLPQENSVVELFTGGGMPGPGGLRHRHIWITNVGEVFVNESYYGNNFNDILEGGIQREYLLGNVVAQDLVDLQKAVDGIRGGGLTKPQGPQCMDAPGYSYTVAKGTALVTVFSRSGCRDSQLKDKSQRPAALAIKNFLDQWNLR